MLKLKNNLNILQHNVGCHWFAPYDPPECINRITAIAEKAKRQDIDIFNIQELYTFNVGGVKRTKELTAFSTALKSQGIPYSAPCAKNSCPFFGMDLGLRIFSRYPIGEYKLYPFRTQDSANLVTPNKGFLEAEIDMNGQTIGVVNIHLSSKSSSIREKQLDELSHYIRENRDKFDRQYFTLIMGDFNMPLSRFMDLPNILPVGVSTHDTARQIDNVFLKSSQPLVLTDLAIVDWKTTTGKSVSDHRGVIFSLQF
jgi:endonuclease/exonuclease/phosphatase (EEP) superfamily protein YafD